ncbi:MAG: hypothetical protein QOD91_2451 [Frankiales bacterium]|jgi:hypothetical protein|nr:hypothetical protein [Frankiales bacterium]
MTVNARRLRVASFIVAALVGILASGGLMWRASYEAFSATTTNGPSTWSSGSVSLSATSPATALFNVSNMKPDGVTHSACINVTYTGSLAATVKLYVASGGLTGSGLDPYLNWQIIEGTGSTNASCSGFVAGSTLYGSTPTAADNSAAQTNLTLHDFATTKTAFGSGVGTWAPAGGSNATESYQLVYELANTNSAESKTASVTFTWEAQNS